MKKSKCEFGVQQVEYLGHIVSKAGMATRCKKVAAMQQWPRPCNVKQLMGFLGLTRHYRRFFRHYELISRPLTNLGANGRTSL